MSYFVRKVKGKFEVCKDIGTRIAILKRGQQSFSKADSLVKFLTDNPIEVDLDNIPKPDPNFKSKRHESATPMAIAPRGLGYYNRSTGN